MTATKIILLLSTSYHATRKPQYAPLSAGGDRFVLTEKAQSLTLPAVMNKNPPKLPAALALSLALSITALTATAAEEAFSPAAPRGESMLVLRNGQVIRGQISRVGDLYYIALPNGEIRLKTADVEFACQTIDEAYRRKRASIEVGNAEAHLRLSLWCQRHGLLGSAATELAAAMAAEPNNSLIRPVRQRLSLLIKSPPATDSTAETTAAKNEPEDGDCQESAASTKEKAAPSWSDLERLVAGMPQGTMETFTQTIQPLLINNCTAAGCHGPGAKSDFRLQRALSGRRPTQKNLYEVMQLVDRRSPSASPLLLKPGEPHADTGRPVFRSHQTRQYQMLVDWVAAVAGRDMGKDAEDSRQQPGGSGRLSVPPVVAADGLAVPSTIPRLLSVPDESKPIPTPAKDSAVTTAGGLEDIIPAKSRIKRGAPLRRFEPRDPFDPEIFNRRYFGTPDDAN